MSNNEYKEQYLLSRDYQELIKLMQQLNIK